MTHIKFLVISLLVFTSCDTSKTAVNSKLETQAMTSEQMHTMMLNKGYSIGTIKYLDQSKCPYVIFDETTKVLLDPINFEAPKFDEFKRNDEKVYFKYRPLRRMNRCNDASPVELEDLKKRLSKK